MAVDYDTAGTGIFVHLGVIIKYYDLFLTDNTNLDADRDAILDSFQLGDQDTAIDGLVGLFAAWQAEYVSRRLSLVQFVIARLQDRTSVLEEIDAPDDDIDTVMAHLIAKMIVDVESVDGATTITAGAPSAGGSNVGDGECKTTKLMDGVQSPGTRHGVSFPPNPNYNAVESEFLLSEVLTLTCVADSYQDGLVEGSEDWELTGDIENASPHDVLTQFSDGAGQITTMAGESIIANGDFENFTSDLPDGWDLDDGVITDNVNDEAVEFTHGLLSLEFLGTAAATIGISQTMETSRLTANQMYHLQIWYKTSGAGIVAGDLTIQFEGTGYTAASSEKITANIAALAAATSWTLGSFFIVLPAVIPADFEITIVVANTLTSGETVWFDDLQFAPVDYMAGFGLAVGRGDTPWARGDLFTITNVLAGGGTFQKFFTRVLGYQLPHHLSGSETILDSLAE